MANKCVGTPTWLQANLLALCAPLPMSLFIHLRGCINITKAFNHLACLDWEHRQWRLRFSSGLNAHHLATTNLFNGWHHSHHILLKHFISIFWSCLDCWLLYLDNLCILLCPCERSAVLCKSWQIQAPWWCVKCTVTGDYICSFFLYISTFIIALVPEQTTMYSIRTEVLYFHNVHAVESVYRENTHLTFRMVSIKIGLSFMMYLNQPPHP